MIDPGGYDIRKLVTYTASASTPQTITPIGYNLGDEDILVYGIDTFGASTLISTDLWSMDTERTTLTLQFAGSFAQVLVLVDTDTQQKLAYTRDSSFAPLTLEDQLDRLTLNVAWINDRLAACLNFPADEATPPDGNVGSVVARQGKFLGFDAAGDPTLYDIDLTASGPELEDLVKTAENVIVADGVEWTSITKAQFLTLYGLDDTLVDADIGATVQPYDPTVLADADIGVTVQGHSAPLDTVETTLTDTDSAVPTSGAVVGYVASHLTSRVIVKQASDLAGTLDSTKAYVLDGIIDMGAQSITVPVGGLTILGQSFDISGLTSSADNYTMFVSESIAIGSGDFLGNDFYISVTGAASKVYELYDATGFNAVELNRVNYNDCTSLGDLYDYRQGLELGTGRFGGSPSLTLHGLWRGGFRISTSIVRSLAGTMVEPLFKSGALFQMDSRFLTDINCDLPTLAPLHDLSPSEFPNASTVQLRGCEITRDGAYNAEDANLTPNMDRGDLCSYWKANNGLPSTFVGATISVTGEELTTISLVSTYYDLEGVFTGTNAQHFSTLADGKATHLGNNPREFEVTGNLVLESTANNSLTIRFRKWDASVPGWVDLDYTEQTRVVNNSQGGRDVAYFTLLVGVTLDQNDYLQLQVRNNSGNSDVTAELSSFYRIQER